ncbi:MAG: UDP-N-acetylmuramate dehydrogenase [Burkholderiaceae bacterium]|nr:UDP-N-acetylmuramate dehydrogenase [Burkholderiaceae bacterium]
MAINERTGVSLRASNSFGVEARAARLIEVEDAGDLAVLAEHLRDGPAPLVLGGGSNILFTRDPPMPVVRIAVPGRRLLADDARGVLVEGGAVESWHDFVQWTLAQGLAGLENLSLIPGTVGASPIQNIGAYGVEMRERFDSLDAVSLRDGTRRRFDVAECGFGYRDSVFRHEEGRGWAIVAVRFRLAREAPLHLDYGEIREELRAQGIARPAAHDVARAVCAIRRRKLPDPNVLGNAGSFFRNPIVDAAVADALATREPGLPRFPVAPSDAHGSVRASTENSRPAVKLSAGWLIERCGWKGHREGDAGVHERHALVLVNHGSASGAQIAALAARIAESVRDRFGVVLEPEPTIV